MSNLGIIIGLIDCPTPKAQRKHKTPAMHAIFIILVVSGSLQQTSARQLLATGEVAMKGIVPEAFNQSGPVQGRALGTGKEERAALVALHGAAGGASWTNKWDLSSADHCSWYGVTCGSSGEVTRLELRSNGLKGTLPAELSALTSLTHL